jgi:Formin Homology 2 Domain
LTPIRNKNISIALHKLKLSLPAITEALLNFDPKILTMNNVSCLLQAAPKEEEFALLENFEGDKEMLDLPEKFVLALSKV